MIIKFIKQRLGARKFRRGTKESAGFDICANVATDVKFAIDIPPHETTLVPTGICTEMPKGTVGLVFPRSGLATKRGLRLANCVAVIDSDYRGEWFVPLHNDSNVVRTIEHGERIAQVIFLKLPKVKMKEIPVEKFNANTERGNGGFGSTGKRG